MSPALPAMYLGEAAFELPTPKALISDVIRRVAFEMGESVPAIIGDGRQTSVVRARFAVAFVASIALGKSTTQIGVALGSRDHSTIINALVRAQTMRATDLAFRLTTDKLVAHYLGKS